MSLLDCYECSICLCLADVVDQPLANLLGAVLGAALDLNLERRDGVSASPRRSMRRGSKLKINNYVVELRLCSQRNRK